MIDKSHKRPVLFAPTDPHDIKRYGQLHWWTRVEWLLLDCDDQLRRQRLKQRPEWTDTMIAEAISDTALLRQGVQMRVDTGSDTPDGIARTILGWLEWTSKIYEEDVS